MISPRLAKRLSDALQQFCFPAGTEIAVAGGSKGIEEIEVGEMVWAQSDRTGEVELKRVKQLFVHVAASLVVITAGTNTIEATDEHPFWVAEQGWKAAGQVQVGDELWTRSGERIRVTEVGHKKGQFTVYNFEVEDAHTYFAGGHALLTHNASCRKQAVAYENKIRDLHGGQNLKSRQFKDSNGVTRTADNVANIDGKQVAIEAKFVNKWESSIRNPNSSIGGRSFSLKEQQEVIDQARRYTEAFDEVVYHTNSREFAEHYGNLFRQNGIGNFKFILTGE